MGQRWSEGNVNWKSTMDLLWKSAVETATKAREVAESVSQRGKVRNGSSLSPVLQQVHYDNILAIYIVKAN